MGLGLACAPSNKKICALRRAAYSGTIAVANTAYPVGVNDDYNCFSCQSVIVRQPNVNVNCSSGPTWN